MGLVGTRGSTSDVTSDVMSSLCRRHDCAPARPSYQGDNTVPCPRAAGFTEIQVGAGSESVRVILGPSLGDCACRAHPVRFQRTGNLKFPGSGLTRMNTIPRLGILGS
jgi:hypothetical protein